VVMGLWSDGKIRIVGWLQKEILRQKGDAKNRS